MRPHISIVIPVYNERENLEILLARIHPIVDHDPHKNFEVIFIDDGSSDGSSELLDSFHTSDPRYKTIHFSRNFGHQAALQAGLDVAMGNAVVMMDADLQDPPELISTFIAKWIEGYEVVYAIRKRRQESALKRLAYRTFYRTLKSMSDIDIPLNAGDFCLMDRCVVQELVGLREHNRFIRGLRSWVGFRQIGVEFDRSARNAGVPKYTLRKLLTLAFSGYIGFTTLPLRVAVWLGLLAAGAGFMLILWIVISRLTETDIPQGWASTNAITLFMSGIQLVVLGVIGEFLHRVYDEVRKRPLYIVRSRTGFAEEEKVRDFAMTRSTGA